MEEVSALNQNVQFLELTVHAFVEVLMNFISPFIALLLFVGACSFPSRLDADIDYIDATTVSVRINVGGQFLEFPCPIDLKNPDNNDFTGWGFVTHNTGVDGKQNCNGVRYNFHSVSIDPNWSTTVVLPAPWNVAYTVTQVDNKAYYDYYYRIDYTGPSSCDYSKNCHGYAFDVGDWPDDSQVQTLMGINPVPPGQSAPPPCYIPSNKRDAEVASDTVGHSIKVFGSECEAGSAQTGGGGIGIPEEPVLAQAIIQSNEQLRESGIYIQTETCPQSVNVRLAHWRAGFNGVNAQAFEPELFKKP